MDVIGNITGNNYDATESDLRELGALSVGAERLKETIGTTYLRAMVKSAQISARLGMSPLESIDAAHSLLYPHVLDGVTTPDVVPLAPAKDHREANKRRALDRNARSNFARTAASTLRRFVAAGGDLHGIDLDTVTKASLALSASLLEHFDVYRDVCAPPPGPRSPGEQKARDAFRRFQRTVAKWATASETERDYKISFLRAAASQLETAAENV